MEPSVTAEVMVSEYYLQKPSGFFIGGGMRVNPIVVHVCT